MGTQSISCPPCCVAVPGACGCIAQEFWYPKYQFTVPSITCGSVTATGTYTLTNDLSSPYCNGNAGCCVWDFFFGSASWFLFFADGTGPFPIPCSGSYGPGWYLGLRTGGFGSPAAYWGLTGSGTCSTSPTGNLTPMCGPGPYAFNLCANSGCLGVTLPPTITVSGLGSPTYCCSFCTSGSVLPATIFVSNALLFYYNNLGIGGTCSCMGGGSGFSCQLDYNTATNTWQGNTATGCGTDFAFELSCKFSYNAGIIRYPSLAVTFSGCSETGIGSGFIADEFNRVNPGSPDFVTCGPPVNGHFFANLKAVSGTSYSSNCCPGLTVPPGYTFAFQCAITG